MTVCKSRFPLHDILRAINLLRAPIIVALIAAIAIIAPGQSREIFKSIQDSDHVARDAFLEIVIPAIGFATTIFAACIFLLASAPERRQDAINNHRNVVESIAIGLTLLPILAVAIANISAIAPHDESVYLAPPHKNIKLALAAAIGSSAITALLFMWLTGPRTKLIAFGMRTFGGLMRIPALHALAIATAAIAFTTLLILYQPIDLPQAIGPIAIILLFFSSICITASLMTFIYDQYQLPLLTILAVAAVTWSVAGLNNNHQMQIATSEQIPAKDVVEEFKLWLDSRKDLDDYKTAGRPFPVYFVTAEGGALYAAGHAAGTLARLQDSCPGFAHHVFAISGVSGGSLGGSLFAALVKQLTPQQTTTGCLQLTKSDAFESATRKFFQQDFLSPVLAAALFPDFFQRFWPWPIQALDRSRALTRSFEEAWNHLAFQNPTSEPPNKNPFTQSLRELWNPKGDAPALLLNTTIAQSGDRAIIAPFLFQDDNHMIPDLEPDAANLSLRPPLSAAVAASAIFPFLTAAVTVEHPQRKIQLVDGGYYENTGIATAADVATRIKSELNISTPTIATPHKKDSGAPNTRCAEGGAFRIQLQDHGETAVCVIIIAIKTEPLTPAFDKNFGEIISPPIALYNTRAAHGYATTTKARQNFCTGICRNGDIKAKNSIYLHYLFLKTNYFPLGWIFSRSSMDWLLSADKALKSCQEDQPPQRIAAEGRQNENACLLKRIEWDLKLESRT